MVAEVAVEAEAMEVVAVENGGDAPLIIAFNWR